nr:uncharacterized protein LOC106842501 isoform X3 [Equus asinus]
MAARQHQLRRNSPPPPPPPPPPARRGPARKEKTIYPSLSLCCFLAYITINARPTHPLLLHYQMLRFFKNQCCGGDVSKNGNAVFLRLHDV